MCVCVSGWMSQVCTQNGGRTRHFVQLSRWPCAPHAPPHGTGGYFVVVCFECRLVAWECCYLKLLVASLRFGFDGVRSLYICCSLFVVVVLLKFSLFLFCSLPSSFSCCLQVAPSLATWPALVSLSAASLNCFPSPSTNRYSCLL